MKESSSLSASLEKRFKSIEYSRLKMEDLARSGSVNQTVVLHMYEGIFLSAHVAFESFLEELFVGLLVDGRGLKSSRPDVEPRIIVRTHSMAREILSGSSKRYIDWMPYNNTSDRAQIYFRGGRPFTQLTENQKQQISKCYVIRNVIAHKSRESVAKFEKQVLGNTPLPPNEKKPAGYLRGFFRASPPRTRYENYMAELLNVARDLAR